MRTGCAAVGKHDTHPPGLLSNYSSNMRPGSVRLILATGSHARALQTIATLRDCRSGTSSSSGTMMTPVSKPYINEAELGCAAVSEGDKRTEPSLRRRFRGEMLQLAGGFALVQYDDLHQDAEGEQPLLEWFPVPGVAALDSATVPTSDPVHQEAAYLLRPEPPDEVSPRDARQ